VCAVDADAVLEEDALLRVARPILDDPELVAATGGIVRIANGCGIEHGRLIEVGLPKSRLATMQVVEYFRAFLVGRVGWSRLNSLLIISGAFGLFRRSLLEAVGGYSTKTVGEDAELVVRLHHYLRERDEPYRISFVPDPVCWTEAPEDFRALGRQRRRWERGFAETLWRHRSVAFRPHYGALGLVAVPYFLFFELLGPPIELLGYVVIPVAAGFGLISIEFFLAFLVVGLLLGVLLSISALAIEEFSFRRHPSGPRPPGSSSSPPLTASATGSSSRSSASRVSATSSCGAGAGGRCAAAASATPRARSRPPSPEDPTGGFRVGCTNPN
jgi:cellulose synthase/poly-beta-1,6-N-acetylglucosamine synthase-like glycosyltransferase